MTKPQYTKDDPLRLTFTRETECEVEYWYEDGGDPSYGCLEHIQSQIDEGYVEGELISDTSRGWWKLID